MERAAIAGRQSELPVAAADEDTRLIPAMAVHAGQQGGFEEGAVGPGDSKRFEVQGPLLGKFEGAPFYTSSTPKQNPNKPHFGMVEKGLALLCFTSSAGQGSYKQITNWNLRPFSENN